MTLNSKKSEAKTTRIPQFQAFAKAIRACEPEKANDIFESARADLPAAIRQRWEATVLYAKNREDEARTHLTDASRVISHSRTGYLLFDQQIRCMHSAGALRTLAAITKREFSEKRYVSRLTGVLNSSFSNKAREYGDALRLDDQIFPNQLINGWLDALAPYAIGTVEGTSVFSDTSRQAILALCDICVFNGRLDPVLRKDGLLDQFPQIRSWYCQTLAVRLRHYARSGVIKRDELEKVFQITSNHLWIFDDAKALNELIIVLNRAEITVDCNSAIWKHHVKLAKPAVRPAAPTLLRALQFESQVIKEFTDEERFFTDHLNLTTDDAATWVARYRQTRAPVKDLSLAIRHYPDVFDEVMSAVPNADWTPVRNAQQEGRAVIVVGGHFVPRLIDAAQLLRSSLDIKVLGGIPLLRPLPKFSGLLLEKQNLFAGKVRPLRALMAVRGRLEDGGAVAIFVPNIRSGSRAIGYHSVAHWVPHFARRTDALVYWMATYFDKGQFRTEACIYDWSSAPKNEAAAHWTNFIGEKIGRINQADAANIPLPST